MKRHTLLILVTILIAALVSCSYENTATVTIDTGIRQQAQLNWFERVLAFLTLSQPLQADPVPGNLPYPVNRIIITVSASDMSTIQRDIDINTGKITLEVPAGSQRMFEIVAGEESAGFYKYYGGLATIDLSSGQQVNLNIEMGLLFDPTHYDGGITYYPWNSQIIISAYTQTNPNVIAFKLYRKIVGSNFPEEYYITITNFNFYPNQYSIEYQISITLDESYEYYISAINNYGEGNKNYVYIETP